MPLQLGPMADGRGRNFTYIEDIRGCSAQIGGFYTHTHTHARPTPTHTKARVPFHSSVPAITVWKSCPFPTLSFICWLRNSHKDNNDAFHKLMKSKLFECPYNLVRGGGNSHRPMSRPNWWILHKKFAGCPFTQVRQLRLLFQKGTHFQHFFS